MTPTIQYATAANAMQNAFDMVLLQRLYGLMILGFWIYLTVVFYHMQDIHAFSISGSRQGLQ